MIRQVTVFRRRVTGFWGMVMPVAVIMMKGGDRSKCRPMLHEMKTLRQSQQRQRHQPEGAEVPSSDHRPQVVWAESNVKFFHNRVA